MRVMKSRKVLKHNLLIEEVCAIYECLYGPYFRCQFVRKLIVLDLMCMKLFHTNHFPCAYEGRLMPLVAI